MRDLTSGEIVEQILAVERDNNIRISNVVFMGIGEPLDNFENVVNAIGILNNQKGLNIGARHISISTSGLVPRIYDLAKENIQCTLSISLHATTDETRNKIMPISEKYNIDELMKACSFYTKNTNYRRIVAVNGSLLVLGALGVITPSTSSLIHNLSTMLFGALSTKSVLGDDYSNEIKVEAIEVIDD